LAPRRQQRSGGAEAAAEAGDGAAGAIHRGRAQEMVLDHRGKTDGKMRFHRRI